MDICNCSKDLDAYLCDIPYEWREGIVKALCFVLHPDPTTCTGIKSCETLTELSAFKLLGSSLSIDYRNEKGSVQYSTLDISQALENSLDGIDPKCLTSSGNWAILTHTQRLQLLMDKMCICCPVPTTTTSTTTTTTLPCLVITDIQAFVDPN